MSSPVWIKPKHRHKQDSILSKSIEQILVRMKMTFTNTIHASFLLENPYLDTIFISNTESCIRGKRLHTMRNTSTMKISNQKTYNCGQNQQLSYS